MLSRPVDVVRGMTEGHSLRLGAAKREERRFRSPASAPEHAADGRAHTDGHPRPA